MGGEAEGAVALQRNSGLCSQNLQGRGRGCHVQGIRRQRAAYPWRRSRARRLRRDQADPWCLECASRGKQNRQLLVEPLLLLLQPCVEVILRSYPLKHACV